MMSGDDRQNSPSISRQNRPSATGAFQNAIDIFAFNFIIFAFSTDLSSAFNAWAVHLA
jgi:hypothetical protein